MAPRTPWTPTTITYDEFNLPGQGISAQLNLALLLRLPRTITWAATSGRLSSAAKSVTSTSSTTATTKPRISLPWKRYWFPPHPEWGSNFKDSNYYDGTYKFGTNLTDYSKVRTWALANLPVAVDVPDSIVGNFDLIERISAGYLMNTIDLSSRLRLVTGLRFEATHVDTLSYDSTQPFMALTSHAGGDYLDVLPSASLRIALDKESNLRLVYGRGLARPNPEDMTTVIGDTGNSIGGHEEYNQGNPLLKAEYADNFDVLYERYMKPIGLIQAGYFYKAISSPIVQDISPIIASGPDSRRCIYPDGQCQQCARSGTRSRIPAASFLSAGTDALPWHLRQLQLHRVSDHRSRRPFGPPGASPPGTEYLELQPDVRHQEVLDARRHDLQRRDDLRLPVDEHHTSRPGLARRQRSGR